MRRRRCAAHTQQTDDRKHVKVATVVRRRCTISGKLLWSSRNSARETKPTGKKNGSTAMVMHVVKEDGHAPLENVEELGLVCGTQCFTSAADSDTRVTQNGEGRRQGKVTHNGRSDGEGTGTDGAKAQQERDTYGRNMEEHVREIGRRHGYSWCWRCCREGHKVVQCVVVVDSAFDDQQNHHQGVQQHRVDGTRGRHGATRLCTTQAGHERQMDRLR